MQDTYDHLCLIGEGTKAQGPKVIFPVISVARSSIKRNFPGGPVVKNLSCKKKKESILQHRCRGCRFNPWLGN